MSNLVHNERVKYAATFFNNIGVASAAIGGVLKILTTPNIDAPSMLVVIGCAAFGIVCLFASYYLLGSLKELT